MVTQFIKTVAMKLLVEDEYIIDTVLMNCVTTLNTHFGWHGELNEIPHIAKGVKRDTRRSQVDSLREAKNVVLAVSTHAHFRKRLQSSSQLTKRCLFHLNC